MVIGMLLLHRRLRHLQTQQGDPEALITGEAAGMELQPLNMPLMVIVLRLRRLSQAIGCYKTSMKRYLR